MYQKPSLSSLHLSCVQFFTGQTFQEWVDVSFRGGSRNPSRNGSKHSVKCASLPFALLGCIALLCGLFTSI